MITKRADIGFNGIQLVYVTDSHIDRDNSGTWEIPRSTDIGAIDAGMLQYNAIVESHIELRANLDQGYRP